jgi:membrane fusion protein (multidrug efflux system)
MATTASPLEEPGRPDFGRGRRRRSTRYVPAALGLLIIVGTLGGLKCAQISTIKSAAARSQKAGPPPETVNTARAQDQSWDVTLDTVGSVAPSRGVSISNESAGMVSRIHFQSGSAVEEGDLLVELDTTVERGQLASAIARKNLAAVNAERSRALFASASIARAQLDADNSALQAATADANALMGQIQRKTVRAPFSGKLGIRLVNLGQYLAAGTPITTLESGESNYVDFALPQQDLSRVSVGMAVRLTLGVGDAGVAPPPAQGTLFAVDPAVDPTTRNIKLRATIPPEADWLRPGMFVNVSVIEPEKETIVAIPSTAIVHASFGDSVFVVEDEKDAAGQAVMGPDGNPSKVARQQFVRIGARRGDFVAVLEGIKAGEEVVTAGAFKLRNGARVAVSTAVELHPELTPHPPNR